jgi:DNA-binding transcriptional MerR regulator
MEGLATSREVAEYLKVHPQTLDAWASKGTGGPPYIKLDGRRRYDWTDVLAWLEERKVRHG